MIDATILNAAHTIGRTLVQRYPASGDIKICVPNDGVEPITEALTAVIAEVLQAWLDAGSEREVTMEELYQPILEHVAGWSEASMDGGDDDPDGYTVWLRWKEEG